MRKSLGYLLLLTLFLTGCRSWRSLPAGPYKNRHHQFSSTFPAGWARLAVGPYFLATRDGIALDYIAVSRQPMGETLKHTKKQFLSGMTTAEIAEVDLDDIRSREHIGGFELIQQDPVTVDGHEGYRYTYRYTTKEGLKIRGEHVGFRVKDAVYRIEYEAAAQHYFSACEDTFTVFLKDFKVL